MRVIPMRAKIGLAFFVSLCAQTMLADQPVVPLNSPAALGAVMQQVGIGLALGFAVRLVFASVELAGEIVGLQMGLNFASFSVNQQCTSERSGAFLWANGYVAIRR